jgi:hypothetical protein
MPLDADYQDAQRIARELITEIASEWADTPNARCVKGPHRHVFEFTLKPSRYSRLTAPLTHADSVVRFDPFAAATRIVLAALEGLRALHAMGIMTEKERDDTARHNAKLEILEMIKIAPDLFSDAIWQAQLIAGTNLAVKQITPSGRLDIVRRIVNSSFEAIQEKLRRRLPVVSKTKSLKISSDAIARALEKFFPDFKKTGALPSQRQFAIAIGVSPKAWRTFLDTHDLDKHEITVRQWYEVMLREEPTDTGDFPLPR